WIEIVRRDLPIRHLPDRLVGKTLVQISDLHIGQVVDEDYIKGAMERVSSLEPDILALTGDYMTCHGNEQIGKVVDVLTHLRHGRLATVSILGNHDYAAGWSQLATADELTGQLTDMGIEVLRNERKDVEGLTIVGLDDIWGPCFAPEKVMPTIEPNQP